MADERCEPECVICAYFNGDLDDVLAAQAQDEEPFSDEWLEMLNNDKSQGAND